MKRKIVNFQLTETRAYNKPTIINKDVKKFKTKLVIPCTCKTYTVLVTNKSIVFFEK